MMARPRYFCQLMRPPYTSPTSENSARSWTLSAMPFVHFLDQPAEQACFIATPAGGQIMPLEPRGEGLEAVLDRNAQDLVLARRREFQKSERAIAGVKPTIIDIGGDEQDAQRRDSPLRPGVGLGMALEQHQRREGQPQHDGVGHEALRRGNQTDIGEPVNEPDQN